MARDCIHQYLLQKIEIKLSYKIFKIFEIEFVNIYIIIIFHLKPSSQALPVQPAWQPQENDPAVLVQSPLQQTDG